MSAETKIYLSFQLAEQWYGIDARWIVEVLWLVYLDELPGAEHDVLGVLNLHGNTMPVIDLRKRFSLHEKPLTLYTPIITTCINDVYVAFLVDAIQDIIEISTVQLEETVSSPFIKHTAHINNTLFRIVDAVSIASTMSTV